MESLQVEYRFTFPDNTTESVHLELDPATFELVRNIPNDLPYWTALSFHKCAHCPLDPYLHPRCPLAANMVNIVKSLTKSLPYQKLHLDVITEARAISKDTTLQAAVGSLMGFVMPTSGCPHTAFLSPWRVFMCRSPLLPKPCTARCPCMSWRNTTAIKTARRTLTLNSQDYTKFMTICIP